MFLKDNPGVNYCITLDPSEKKYTLKWKICREFKKETTCKAVREV